MGHLFMRNYTTPFKETVWFYDRITMKMMSLLVLMLLAFVHGSFLDFSVFENSTEETNSSFIANIAYVEHDVNQLYEKMLYEREVFLKPVEEVSPVVADTSESWEDGFTILNEKTGLQEKVLDEILRVKNDTMTMLEVCTENDEKIVSCDQVFIFYMLTPNETQYVKRNLRIQSTNSTA
jgi:hypothetical protein